ncbi:hypothetical protein M8R19_27340 [Pseudomonas sp. R3.Fl]|uniref:hypothetical protein n=1 Tax=Pseudomonas TaxID=286 RepID=UPI00201D47C9|nr:hypothetical protein [Pseudomonas sp. R3.Fl]MCL6692407.1 hypothetical protein [Pseudomonas sp. R3.Fl]
MKPSSIRRELRDLITEAEKLEGDLARHQLNWAEWSAGERLDAPPDWLIDNFNELVRPFEHLATSIYLSTVALLDAEGMHAYLKQFYLRFGEELDSSKAASEFDTDHYWSGEPYNLFLSRFRQFIAPLDVIGDSGRYLKLSGVQYLETVLKNTASIIHKSGKTPKSETDVYKSVRHVLEAIFPSAKSPKANFIKSAQEYKPDILIPELSVAVEYKYAADEARLKSVIAQISDDVKGYSGDDDYNLFYAVFYVTEDFWGESKFKEVWRDKDFPRNWRWYYIVGK